MTNYHYEVGDTITYQTFGGPYGETRTVKVTYKESDIKNGRPGFDGVMDNGDTVWGYDDQIVRVGR